MLEEHIYESIDDFEDDDLLSSSASRRHLIPPPLPCRNGITGSPAYVSPVRMRRNRPRLPVTRIRTNARAYRDTGSIVGHGVTSNEVHSSTSALPQYHSIRDVRAHNRLSMRDVSATSRFVDHQQFEDTSSANDQMWEDEELTRYNQRASMSSLVAPRRRYLDELERREERNQSKFNRANCDNRENGDFFDNSEFVDHFSNWSLGGNICHPIASGATSSKGGRQYQRANSQSSSSAVSCVSATGLNEIEFDPKPWKPLQTKSSIRGTLC